MFSTGQMCNNISCFFWCISHPLLVECVLCANTHRNWQSYTIQTSFLHAKIILMFSCSHNRRTSNTSKQINNRRGSATVRTQILIWISCLARGLFARKRKTKWKIHRLLPVFCIKQYGASHHLPPCTTLINLTNEEAWFILRTLPKFSTSLKPTSH